MRKHIKQFLALLLSLIMLIGLLPFSAFAADDKPAKAEANGGLKITVRIPVGSSEPRLEEQIREGSFSITFLISAVPEEGDTSLHKLITLKVDSFSDSDEDGIWEGEASYSNLPPMNYRVSLFDKEDHSEVPGYLSDMKFDPADPEYQNCGFIEVKSGETAEMTFEKYYQPAYGNLVITKNFSLPEGLTLSDFIQQQISSFMLDLYYEYENEPMAAVFVEDGEFASKEGSVQTTDSGFVWTLRQILIGNYYLEEYNADPREYDLDPFLPKDVVIEPGETTETTLTNVYREPGSRVTITKILSGIGIDDLPEGAAVVLKGEGDTAYRVLFSNFTEVDDGVLFYSLPAPAAGQYSISEENVEIDGYWLTTEGNKTVTVEENTDASIQLNNNYTSKNGNLYVAKIIEGLPKDEELDIFPEGATFRIEGPKEFNNGTGEMTVTFGNDFDHQYSTRDSHGGGIEGYVFVIKDVPPGLYTVTEDEDSASLENLGYSLDVEYISDTWIYTWKKVRGEDDEATQELEDNQIWIGNTPGTHPYSENRNYGITVVDTYTAKGTLEITKTFEGLNDGVIPEEFVLGLLYPENLPGNPQPGVPIEEAEHGEIMRKAADVKKEKEVPPYVFYNGKMGEFRLSDSCGENALLEQLVNENGDIYGFIWTLTDLPTGTYYVAEDIGYVPGYRWSGLKVNGGELQYVTDQFPVMIGEIGLGANDSETLTVANFYEPAYGYIRITKDLAKDSLPVNIPDGTTFTVRDEDGNIAKDADGNDAVLTYADILAGNNLLKLQAGIRYTVEETKAEVEGYAMTATSNLTDPFYISPIKKSRENNETKSKRNAGIIIASTGPILLRTSDDQDWARENPYVVAFHNKYTSDYGTLTIRKIVKGLPDDLVADGAYTFNCIITPNSSSNELTVSTNEFIKNSDGDYEATIEVDLPWGSYQVNETDYDVDYYDVKIACDVRSVTLGPKDTKGSEYTGAATFTNTYTRRTSTISIDKRIAGIDPEILIEQGFGFEITGPEGFFPEEGGNGKMTVLLADMEEVDIDDEDDTMTFYGRRFRLSVPAGAYTVREINAEVPGYTLYAESDYMQWAHAVIGPIDHGEDEREEEREESMRRGAEAAEIAEAKEDVATAEEVESHTQGDDPMLVKFEASKRIEDGTDLFFGNAYIKNPTLTITKELGSGSEQVVIPADTTFTISDKDGNIVKTVTYAEFENGEFKVDLPIGTYTVKEEKASADVVGYDLNVAYEAVADEAKWELTIDQEITNMPPDGIYECYSDVSFHTIVKNTGGNPLYNVRIYDDLFGDDILIGLMMPGMEIDLGESSYTIYPEDGYAGEIVRKLTGESFKSNDANAEKVTADSTEIALTSAPEEWRVRDLRRTAAKSEEPAGETENVASENEGIEILVTLDNNATVHIINTYTAKTTNVTVNKVWEDEDAPEGTRPDSVTVQLLADGEAYGDPVTLSADAEDGGWTYTWENLLLYDENGKEIEYTVEEVEVTGYTSTVTGSADDGFTITNRYTPPINPDTGDSGRTFLWLSLFLTSLLGMIVISLIRRKQTRA